MLQAATMLLALFGIWMVAAPQAGVAPSMAVAGAASVMSVLVALRFGGVGGAFVRAPLGIAARVRGAGSAIRGVLATLRSALAADVTLAPALVKVKSENPIGPEGRAFASALASAPGFVVVEAGEDGILVHVLDEDRLDPVELGRIERRVTGRRAR
ncbi:MAG: Na+/H+ antiporter subunit E [Hyphomonadaceae bacterium]